MRNLRRRFVSFALFVALVLSMSTQASAVQSQIFTDVPVDSVYFDATSYLSEKNISGGYSDGSFRPDEQISMLALCSFCVKAFMPDMLDRLDKTSAFDFLLSLQVIDSNTSLDSRVDFETGLGIIGRAAGVFPRGVLEELDYTDKDAFRYIRDVGFDLNVLDIRDKISTDAMTRGEAAYLIYSLVNWLESDEARDLTAVEKYGLHYIDISATDAYQSLLPQINGSLLRLPFSVLEKFRNNHYQIIVDDAHIEEYNVEHKGVNAVALFSNSKKTIWTKVGHAVPHEMGHFVQYFIMNDRKSIEPVYKSEKDSLSSLVPKYAVTDSGEYFAEFFGIYIANQDNSVNLAKLKSDMPVTFDYFEKLNETNWATEFSPVGTLSASLVYYK